MLVSPVFLPGWSMPRRDPQETQPLSPDQAREFLSATADDRRLPLFRMAFTFGMRQAEMRGLTWDRVDLDGGLVRVDRWLWGVRLPSRRCELRRGAGGAIRGRSRRSLGARPTPRRPACAPICSPLRHGWRASRSVPCRRNADPIAVSRRHRGACLALVERCPNPLVAGGSGGSRTLDLRIKSPLLCRLSYRPPSRLAGGRPVRRAAGSAAGGCPSRAGRL